MATQTAWEHPGGHMITRRTLPQTGMETLAGYSIPRIDHSTFMKTTLEETENVLGCVNDQWHLLELEKTSKVKTMSAL